MTLVKVRSRGINLADDFTFSGTVSGVGGGKVNQVLEYTAGAAVNTNSNSYVNFGSMAVTITPSATSSKILLMHSAPSQLYIDNTSNMAHVAFFRDSTNITTLGHNSCYAAYDKTNYKEGSSFMFLDSPNSTSAIVYRVKCKVDNASMTFVYGTHYSNGSQPRQASLTVMEILA
jgi:hypothetical protein